MDKMTYNDYFEYLQKKYNKTRLTTSEVGKELSISKNTVLARVKAGKNIPKFTREVYGKGGRIFFPIHSVAEYLAQDLFEYKGINRV